MKKKEKELYRKLLDDAYEATFAAAEAMDRGQEKKWLQFQERAARLRKRAAKLALDTSKGKSKGKTNIPVDRG